MVIKKRSVTLKGLLSLVEDSMELFFPLDRKGVYQRLYGNPHYIYLEDYFPSVVLRASNQLMRRGLAEIIETPEGTIVKITDKGKSELLKYRLSDFKPKSGKWDGKWRLVFFDILMEKNTQRDKLRMYLRMLGMQMLQESVWVSPYDVSSEVKYIREILDIPHSVKLAEMIYLENEEELKELFGI